MSDNKNDFFIGWRGNASAEQEGTIKRILIPVFVAIPILVFAIVFFTSAFGTGKFELGNVQEFTGVYHEVPFPVLLLDDGQLENGSSTSALLVGFGKNGAKTFMHEIEASEGKLSGKRIKIQGTLIYGDGKTLIELTKKEKSVLEVMETQVIQNDKLRSAAVKLEGEIIDPKCWFGVMKPAEGKVHKSCAIRCISGGIPPVFKTRKVDGTFEYYVLKGVNGEDINKEVLEFVGEGVEVKGKFFARNGWKVLELDPGEISYSD